MSFLCSSLDLNFNPRSPHGERRFHWLIPPFLDLFQSTLPARGATFAAASSAVALSQISIHAPRTGSDHHRRGGYVRIRNFNPRSPHGERQDTTFSGVCPTSFQSTLPARGATRTGISPHCISSISIHAPRTGSDNKAYSTYETVMISIHAPRTGSDTRSIEADGKREISIHAPRTGSDNRVLTFAEASAHFNPRSPHGERPFIKLS